MQKQNMNSPCKHKTTTFSIATLQPKLLSSSLSLYIYILNSSTRKKKQARVYEKEREAA